MKRLLPIVAALLCAFVSCSTNQEPGKLEINDLGYYETRGVNVLVYSNNYQGVFCDEKTAGIEIVQRGVRIATGGGVRLMNTPEQWDIYSTLTERTIDTLVIPRDFGYPVCSIEKEYVNNAVGQLRTRFQAFVESIELKNLQKEG